MVFKCVVFKSHKVLNRILFHHLLMTLKDTTKKKIKDEIIKVVDRVIKKRTVEEPFNITLLDKFSL